MLGILLAGGPVYVCRLRDRQQEQHPGCPESLRVLGLVQHPPLSPEYPPHGHQQHCAGTDIAGGTHGVGEGVAGETGMAVPWGQHLCITRPPVRGGPAKAGTGALPASLVVPQRKEYVLLLVKELTLEYLKQKFNAARLSRALHDSL